MKLFSFTAVSLICVLLTLDATNANDSHSRLNEKRFLGFLDNFGKWVDKNIVRPIGDVLIAVPIGVNFSVPFKRQGVEVQVVVPVEGQDARPSAS